MRYDRHRQGAAAVHVHRPHAMECLGGNREEKNSRTCCVFGDGGYEDLWSTLPWWGTKRGRDAPVMIICHGFGHTEFRIMFRL